jgi:hypothetical protein
MGQWILICSICGKEFPHSSIPENLSFADAYLPIKPPFPASGLAIDCPQCGRSATYERCDLRYRAPDCVIVPRIE